MQSKSLGQVAYEAYVGFSGGKSLVSGATLPTWGESKPEIRAAWEAAGEAVEREVVAELVDEPADLEELEQCDRILALCDDVPERGEEFAESVRGKVESIRDWIEEHGEATEAQQQALDNMEEAVGRWIK